MADDAEREHQARTLKAGTELEPRPSIADEQLLTDRVRAHEAEARRIALCDVVGQLRLAERALESALRALPVVDRQTRRDLARIKKALERIGERHAGA